MFAVWLGGRRPFAAAKECCRRDGPGLIAWVGARCRIRIKLEAAELDRSGLRERVAGVIREANVTEERYPVKLDHLRGGGVVLSVLFRRFRELKQPTSRGQPIGRETCLWIDERTESCRIDILKILRTMSVEGDQKSLEGGELHAAVIVMLQSLVKVQLGRLNEIGGRRIDQLSDRGPCRGG